MSNHNHQILEERLSNVRHRIAQAARSFGRPLEQIQLLAVSKTRQTDEIREAFRFGQRAFGESYLQEAVKKIKDLNMLKLEWHFIGRLQSNKTRSITEHFDWVHSLASLKHAERLSAQRPTSLTPLKVCIQVNISHDNNKDGHSPNELGEMIERYANLPNISVQGLMTVPSQTTDLEAQRIPYRRLRQLRDKLRTEDLPLDTLSMGMSSDLEAAIAEGSTLVRIGTAIFGPRLYNMEN